MAAGELETLFNEEYDDLVRFLYARFGAGPPEPEDVAQHAFLKLHDRGHLEDIDNPKAFLWRTASNLVVSGLRAENVRHKYKTDQDAKKPEAEGVHSSPERVIETEQELFLVSQALAGMPLRRRRAFVLHRFEGMSYTAIGRQLGIGRTAVTKHIARATMEIDTVLDQAMQNKAES
ncbi:MAG: RNA polymerase sigma factor [Pseudomonadota bacterium]